MATITRVRTIFTGVPGTPWYSNQWFAGTGDSQAYVDLMGDFWDDIAVSMTAGISYTVQGQVIFLNDATGQVVGSESVDARTGVSGGSTEALPYATQLLINLHTGHYENGREVRGKLYVPGLTEGATVGGVFDNSFVTAFTGFADNIRQAPVIADDFWLVYSPKNNASYPITGNPASSKPAVLRSRRD